MYDLENVPMKQVASVLSIPLFTAYTRLHKARTELETALRRTSEDGSRPCHSFEDAVRVVSMHGRELKHEILEIRDGGPDPAEALQAKQAREMVMRAIEMIPPGRRAVLVMYDLENVPMNQVATTLSIPLFTAYSRLRKARTELETAIRRLSKDGSPP